MNLFLTNAKLIYSCEEWAQQSISQFDFCFVLHNQYFVFLFFSSIIQYKDLMEGMVMSNVLTIEKVTSSSSW